MIFMQATETPSLDIIELLFKGGWVMIPLSFIFLWAVYLIIERWLYFSQQEKSISEKSKRHIELLRSGEGHGAQQLCTTVPGAWGRVFIHAGSGAKQEEADQLLSDAANLEIAQFEKNLSGLSLIAGIAPLLGFIGTIAGVITIFFDISVTQDISIAVISEGLYQKMISSASGLMIGIIAFGAHHLFQQRIDRFARQIQEHALLVKLAMIESRH